MRITESQLRRIIRQEAHALREASAVDKLKSSATKKTGHKAAGKPLPKPKSSPVVKDLTKPAKSLSALFDADLDAPGSTAIFRLAVSIYRIARLYGARTKSACETEYSKLVRNYRSQLTSGYGEKNFSFYIYGIAGETFDPQWMDIGEIESWIEDWDELKQ